MHNRVYTQEAFDEIRKQLMQGNHKNVYFGDYLVYWLEEIFKPRVTNNAYTLASHVVYKWLLPQMQTDVKLQFLNTEYINSVLQSTSSVCKSSANKSYEIINWAVTDAELYNFIEKDLMLNVKKYKREKHNVLVLNRENLRKFLIAMQDTNWYLEVLLGVFCGLRKGEILGLQFSDIKDNSSIVEVNRQLVLQTELEKGSGKVVGRSYALKDPKTENSIRAIRVPTLVQEELRKRKKAYNSAKKEFGKGFQDDGYVSFQPAGAPHTISSFNTVLVKTCTRYGLPRVTPHSLRHMYATILLEQGVPLVKISALLGHSSINTTFNYYCEQMDENSKIIDFMNESFKEGIYHVKKR